MANHSKRNGPIRTRSENVAPALSAGKRDKVESTPGFGFVSDCLKERHISADWLDKKKKKNLSIYRAQETKSQREHVTLSKSISVCPVFCWSEIEMIHMMFISNGN